MIVFYLKLKSLRESFTTISTCMIILLTCIALPLFFGGFVPLVQQIVAKSVSDNVPFFEYSNPYYGFNVEFPSDWTYTESDIGSNDTIYSILNIAPPISQDPTLSTNVQIGIEDLEIGQLPSMDQYARDTVNAYRNSYSNFSLESVQTNTNISGIPAYEIIFTDSSDGLTRKLAETGVIDETNNRAYYLIFETENSTYSQYYPIVQDIFDSFELADSSTLLEEDINSNTEGESLFSFPDEDLTESFSPFGKEDSGLAGLQDFDLFMNSFANSIFNGSSTIAAIGTSIVAGIKVAGITIVEDTSLSDGEVRNNVTDSLTVNLIASDIISNDSVTVIAARIPFSIQDILSFASMNEENQLGSETTPFTGQELSQNLNPFESLSNLQIGSTNLISPDWSSSQSVNMNLVGGGVKTNNPLSQMEKDSLDLVFVSVIPYTGN
jgi:PsbP-like protein